MKLLHRSDVQQTPERVEKTPTSVPESEEVAEHRRRVTTKPAPAAKSARWLRWVPVVLLIAAGMVALSVAISGDEASDDLGPWRTVETGPGSTSLGPTPAIIVADLYNPTTGPGSTSLGPTPAIIVADLNNPTTGPGSTSLGPTPAIEVIEWYNPTTGPGSTSLGSG